MWLAKRVHFAAPVLIGFDGGYWPEIGRRWHLLPSFEPHAESRAHGRAIGLRPPLPPPRTSVSIDLALQEVTGFLFTAQALAAGIILGVLLISFYSISRAAHPRIQAEQFATT